MPSSPAQRSLKHIRSLGYKAQVVEKWNTFANVRQDLFGCIDIVAINGEIKDTLGIQTTSYSNMSARVNKSKDLPVLKDWLKAGNRFEVHGWKRAKNKRNWEVRIKEVTLADYIT